jgi:hypothetical protein
MNIEAPQIGPLTKTVIFAKSSPTLSMKFEYFMKIVSLNEAGCPQLIEY